VLQAPCRSPKAKRRAGDANPVSLWATLQETDRVESRLRRAQVGTRRAQRESLARVAGSMWRGKTASRMANRERDVTVCNAG